MEPIHQVKAGREQQTRVLEVPLAPPLVASGKADQRGGQFLVAAPQFTGQIDLPPGAPHESSLHEVVTENRAAQRCFSRKLGQPAMLDERRHPDDRIMAPIITGAALPKSEARN